MATDPRPHHHYRVPPHHPPGERTAATLSLVVPGARYVGATSLDAALLRGFLDRGDADVAFPPNCPRPEDRAAAVRRLASLLPKLFWARRLRVAAVDATMHGLAVWWERDDARAMLRLAERHCGGAEDAPLRSILERRVEFYDLPYDRRTRNPWWKAVVDAHARAPADVLVSDPAAAKEGPHKDSYFSFDGVDPEALRRALSPADAPVVEEWLRVEASLSG